MSGHRVWLSYGCGRRGVPAARSYRGWLDAVARAARTRKPIEVSLRICGPDEARALNRDFRHKDYVPNVLSFPADSPPGARTRFLGDIAICADVAAREASAQGKRLRDHHAHLFVHGVLHLMGYDHEDEIEAQRMESFEARILGSLGIADPYACPTPEEDAINGP